MQRDKKARCQIRASEESNATIGKAVVLIAFLVTLPLSGAPVWRVRLEEPTGLYRRMDEIVRVPLEKLDPRQRRYVVTDPRGREVPCQVSSDELLFPASLIPGELPEYRVAADSATELRFTNQIVLRRIGLQRVELGNARFRVVIDIGVTAVVEAYSLSAGPQRSLNLVETTPEGEGALKGDIHESERMLLAKVPGVEGENIGWSSLGGVGPMTAVELVETGPLRGKLRLRRTDETWEFTWYANSAALRWDAARGFRFTAISAEPYLPFDRFLGGSEYEWPNGPDDTEPPDHGVASRAWKKLPGGHAVYYQNAENYGALGIVALDSELNWTGIGSRRFQAEKSSGTTAMAITFPRWAGMNTVLEARRENRLLRQPLLVTVSGPKEAGISVTQPAAREPEALGAPPSLPAKAPALPAGKDAGAPSEGRRADTLATAPPGPRSFNLDGEWELAWAEKGAGKPKSGWRKVKVPGSAHIQWLDPSLIYTHQAKWISAKEWWYRKKFQVPQEFRGPRLRLEFEATDYYADAWLNGFSLGRHEGYIDPYGYEVSDAARIGADNELVVRVWAPVNYYWKHRSYTVKGAYGAVDQKPDDITPLGITRHVRLVASEPTVIGEIAVDTGLKDQGAEVAVEAKVDGPLDTLGTWELILSPRNFASSERYRVRAAIMDRSSRLVIPVENPQLWWTWDHGKPNLYTLEVRLLGAEGQVLDRQSMAVGIREIEKIGWIFYLNRKRVFIRGTNYYYNLFLSEMDRSAYERDLKLMLQMNVNLIRLHCHFENREFYDLADENGVLIWQDYLEAWYPHDRAFSLRAAALYDPLIRYVRNHPSVALWTTSDEEDLENYRDLTKHLAARPALLDPQHRPVVRSTGRYGDAHVYHGWYDGSIWEYGTMTEPFVSELGATALPNYETLIKFLPNAWPIKDHAEEWTFRRLQIPEAMRAWGDPDGLTLQEYIPRTQAYVARLFQLALERMRRLKYHPAGGILHFHAIDIWPSVTMAAIDFDRRPTKAFYTVQRSFAPVAANFEYDRDHWRSGESFRCGIWAINDRWEEIPNAIVRWRIVDKAGQTVNRGEWKQTLPADSSQKLGELTWQPGDPGSYELRAEVRSESGESISENVFEFTVGDYK